MKIEESERIAHCPKCECELLSLHVFSRPVFGWGSYRTRYTLVCEQCGNETYNIVQGEFDIIWKRGGSA